MSEWYLYLIRCDDGSLYTGISTDVARRFAQHRGEGGAGSKYLKGRVPLTLVFKRNLGSKSLALKVERKVKKLSKVRKEELVRANTYIDKIIKQVSSQLTV
jgi:putative endonuclease